MSVTVVSARVKFDQKEADDDTQFPDSVKLRALPRGVAVWAAKDERSHATNNSAASNHQFLGITMAPTMSEHTGVHVGVAVGGVCPALVLMEEGKASYHTGTMLGTSSSGYLQKTDDIADCVAMYLQSSGRIPGGGNLATAQVWLTRITAPKAGNLPTAGLGGESVTTADAPAQPPLKRARRGVADQSKALFAAAAAAANG